MARKLKTLLQDQLTDQELAELAGGYDLVGDIAVIKVPAPLVAKERLIAEAVLESNKHIKVVAKKTGTCGGEFRTVPLQVLAGENRLETEVKEAGIRLLVNPQEVYYSVRSGGERRRIAALVKGGEAILVLFSGIAPLPLVLARYSPAKIICGIEKNRIAHEYALQNLRRNRVQSIRLYQGDVRDIVPTLATSFDRVVMPLPLGSQAFLALALSRLKEGGVLHFYRQVPPVHFAQAVEELAAACRTAGRLLHSAAITRCGHCTPQSYRICIDARID